MLLKVLFLLSATFHGKTKSVILSDEDFVALANVSYACLFSYHIIHLID